MLTVVKRRYKKQYVFGVAGIFDTVAGFPKNYSRRMRLNK